MLNPVVPRWDKLKHKHYLSHLIQTARGCPFDCDFCSVSKLFGKPRPKPIAHIVKEIEELKKHVKRPWPLWVSFADDNIIGNPKRAKELFRALIPLKIKWWSQASINLANDEELLELAQQSGCDSLLIGFESVSQKAQQEVNKGKLNKVDDFKRAVKKIQEYGISLYPSFIFGFDDDEKTIFDETYNFLQETGMEFPMLSIMTPWAGTRLHKRLEKEGRLFPIAWEDLHSYSVYYTPKKMTADELLQGHRRTIYKLYSMEAIFERIEIAYENGSLRNKEKNLFFRFLVSTLLFKELLVRDKELKQFVRKLLKIIWTKKNIKSEPLLFLIDRFVFARKLKKASLNQE
ncbi:MAG: radical SAM protein [bacterium]|nr:radical SAM protein [bacterium]